jgi:hypothetical protein
VTDRRLAARAVPRTATLRQVGGLPGSGYSLLLAWTQPSPRQWACARRRLGIGYVDALTDDPAEAVVADGTELAARKLARVLTTDPAMGVLRHADAGYERAIEVAEERGVRLPMRDNGEADEALR